MLKLLRTGGTLCANAVRCIHTLYTTSAATVRSRTGASTVLSSWGNTLRTVDNTVPTCHYCATSAGVRTMSSLCGCSVQTKFSVSALN